MKFHHFSLVEKAPIAPPPGKSHSDAHGTDYSKTTSDVIACKLYRLIISKPQKAVIIKTNKGYVADF